MKQLRNFLIVIVLFIAATSAKAQNNPKIRKSEFNISESGFKKAWENVKEGNKFYKKGKNYFVYAIPFYTDAYTYNKNNAELNYKLGVCHVYSDNKFESIQFLKKAYELDSLISKDIHFMLARGYHLNVEFEKAIREYTFFKNSMSRRKLLKFGVDIDKYVEECRAGLELMKNPLRVIITNLGKDINSIADDYNPIFPGNDSVMYFTSRRFKSKGDRISKLDGKYFEDIYVSNKKNGKWTPAINIGKPINSKRNDAAVEIAKDGTKLYVYNGFKKGGDIRISTIKDGEWKRSKHFRAKFLSRRYRETSISFSKDGNTAYFVVLNRKDGFGGKDIYVSKINKKGRWLKPRNLGPIINTQYNEECVFIHPNDSILYFSSKGHNTMGGYDIFKSRLDRNGEWQNPENIGYPINTPDDDVFCVVNDNEKQGYYSTIRSGGLGQKDIYRFTFLGSEKEMVLTNEDNLIANEIIPIDGIFFKLPEKMQIDTAFYLKGSVTDADSHKPLVAKITLIDSDISQVIATALSDDSGHYRIKIPSKKKFGVEITAKEYLFFLDVISIPANSKQEEIIRDFTLKKVEVGEKVILKNIFFETNKATLTPASYAELQVVLRLLKENPTMRIEISGHTDNIGSLKANTKLSESRAKSVADYIAQNGIERSRLEWKGYAFTQPVATNDTQAGRAQNRRVEFKVLSK